MITLEGINSLSPCSSGAYSFKVVLGNKATFSEVISKMDKSYSVWLIIKLLKSNLCPEEIKSVLRIPYSEETRRQVPRDLLNNWDYYKPKLLALALDFHL